MTEPTDLHDRLLAHARSYDPSVHHRSLLAPYRDVLLLWRAKFMSYEQIAAALIQHGLMVSPAGVGVFCRRTFTKSEIERARKEHGLPAPKVPPMAHGITRNPAPAGPRGPKVARDNY